jgi:hypothetical protein
VLERMKTSKKDLTSEVQLHLMLPKVRLLSKADTQKIEIKCLHRTAGGCGSIIGCQINIAFAFVGANS